MLIILSDVKKQLAAFPGWEIKPKEISKIFVFADFLKAIIFLNQVATEAEKINHHPDIDIRYNKVKITLSTHSEGGTTEKDLVLAKKLSAK